MDSVDLRANGDIRLTLGGMQYIMSNKDATLLKDALVELLAAHEKSKKK